jgi:hypothetical protein
MKIRCLAIGLVITLVSPALAQSPSRPAGTGPALLARTAAGSAQANPTRVARPSTARARPRRVALPNLRRLAERRGYKKVSSLVDFPNFFPGIGILYVKPSTLPNGPFMAFDRRDRLISTIYMIPLEEMSDRKRFELPGEIGKNDHVTLHYNAGHPGVDVPHYHVVIWHVNKNDEARVAQ